MIVVDASLVVEALVGGPSRRRAASARLEREAVVHASHHLDVEVVHALRRVVRLGQVSEQTAQAALARLSTAAIERWPYVGMLDRIWELRLNLSAYDAVYVALAEVMELPLVTCDASLATAPGIRCRVEVVG